MRKRLLATLLSLVMVVSLVPVSALAAEEPADGDENDYYETDGVTDTAVAGVQALIDALPNTEDITADNAGEVDAQLDAIDEAKSVLSDEQMEQLDFDRYAAAAEALSALAGQPETNEPELLAEGDTYTLTLSGYTSSEYYDADVISSIAVKSIGGKEVQAAESYQVTVGDEVILEVTYTETAQNAMAALGFIEAGESKIGLLETTNDAGGKACQTFRYDPTEAVDVTISLAGLTSWSVNNTEMTITGKGSMPNFGWESPASADALHSIYGPYYDTYKSSVTKVTVGEGITHTANWAFMNFTALTEISLPETLTSIGWYLIRNCSNVQSIVIPETVMEIQGGAFSGATSLKKIQTGTTNVEDGVFDIHNVKTLGMSVFSGTAVETIVLPDEMTTIPTMLFSSCNQLKTITIPGFVTEVESNAFSGCGQALTVYFGGTKDQWGAIEAGDTGPNGNGNYNLVKSSNTIYYYSEQTPTSSADFDPTLHYWHYVEDEVAAWEIHYATLMSQGATHSYLYGAKGDSVTLPDLTSENVSGQKTFVGWYSDENLTNAVDLDNLKSPSVTLSDESTVYYAKWDTAKYTAVYILDGGSVGDTNGTYTVTVGYGEVLEAPEAVKEYYVLEGWYTDYALTNQYDFSERVDGNVILYVKWVKPSGTWGDNISWAFDPETGVLSFDGTGAMKNNYTTDSVAQRVLYPWSTYEKGVKSIVIGEGITNVPYQAFDGKANKYYQSVEKITLPSTLTTIDQGSFRGLTKLQMINGDTNGVFDLRGTALSKIEGAVFNSNTNLKIILFPDTLASIGQQAFEKCSSLTALQLPVTFDPSKFGSDVVVNCDNIKVIYLSGTGTSWNLDSLNGAANNYRIINAVKAYLNGGSLPDTVYTENLSTALLTPTQADKALNGWYDSAAPAEGDNVVTDIPEAKSSVYAVWGECLHITNNTSTLSYSASNGVITETCSKCGHKATATLTLPENLTYDGNGKTVTITYSTDTGTWLASDLTVKYYGSNDTAVNSAVNAGTYTAKITVGEGSTAVTASVEFTIEPKSITKPTADTTAFTYNGNVQTYTVADSDDYTVSGSTRMNAGEQTVTVALNDTTNTKWEDNSTGDVTFTFAIAKATPTISISTDKTSPISGAATVTLTVSGAPTEGTVTMTCDAAGINVTDNGNNTFSVTLPNETKDYNFTASYMAEENGNYNNVASAAYKVSVTRYTSGGSSSGGGSSTPTYTVSTPSTKNGTVTVSPRNASKGTTVTITVKPNSGYELDDLTVTDKNGNAVKLTRKSDTQYTFTMPASRVTVEATFAEIVEEPDVSFIDVPANAYYADAVAWAVENGVTNGTSATTFSPDVTCTRAQTVTFLWRAAGSPAPRSSVNPFTDVQPGAYYYEAVLWAVENGITKGTSATTFSPDDTVTRGQTVTFQHRAAGSPAASGGTFADVAADAYYAPAVQWAVANGITNGTSSTTFSPDDPCTRGQIVTFLYRDMA